MPRTQYRRSGFECEFFWLQIVGFYTRRHQKNRRKKKMQWIILHVTTPLLLKHMFSRSQTCMRSIYFHASTYSCRSSRMSLRFFKPTVNTQPSATVAWIVWYSTHLTCMQFFVWQFAIIRIAIWLVQHHSQWFNYTFKTPVSNFHEDAQFWESLYSVRTEAT